MRPRLTMVPHPEPSASGQPQVFIEALCDHGALLFTYEADAGHTFDEVEQRGLAAGKAHAMAEKMLRCPCWREGARTSVGMPEEWQVAGLGSQHRRWGGRMKKLLGFLFVAAAIWAGGVIGGLLTRLGLSLWECLALLVLYGVTVLMVGGRE